MNQMFAPKAQEVHNRMAQAGLAVPGQPGPAGMQMQVNPFDLLANIVGDLPIRHFAHELYRDRKLENPGGDMLDQMRESVVEALAFQPVWEAAFAEWMEARRQAAQELAEEAAKTPEKQATEGGVPIGEDAPAAEEVAQGAASG